MKFASLFLIACIGLPGRTAEHPHLLFSAEDLPALRETANSPEGKRWMTPLRELLRLGREAGFAFHGETAEAMMKPTWAAGEGFLYLLTGDEQHAEQAMIWVWEGMYGSLADKNQWRQAYRVAHIALAYDFCAPAWPEDFRKNVRHFLFRQVEYYANGTGEEPPDRFNTGGRYQYAGETASRNRGPGHAEHRRYLAAAGLAALAIRHDPLEPFAPPEPGQIKTVSPAADLILPPGMPAVRLRDGEMFSEWIANGPFPTSDPDPLKALGGFADARPVPGTRVSVGDVSLDFRPYHPASASENPVFYPRDCMKIFTRSTGRGFPPGRRVREWIRETEGPTAGTALVLYTLWEVEQAKTVRAFPNLKWSSRNVRMWLNGTEIRDDEVVRVEPGLYPVMVHMPVTGGYARQAPHFEILTPERLAEEQAGYQAAKEWFTENPKVLDQHIQEIFEEINRFAAVELAFDGTETKGLTDHFPLFALAHKRAFRDDPLQGTGLEQSPVAAGLWRDMHGGEERLRMALNLLPLLSEWEARIAAWLLENTEAPVRRPTDAFLPLLAMAAERVADPEQPPGFLFLQGGSGARLVRHPEGRLLGLMGGTASERPLSLVFAEGQPGGRPISWLNAPGHERASEDWAAIPRISGREAPGPAQPLHADPGGSRTPALALRTPDIDRSVWADLDGPSPILLIADTFRDVGLDEEKHIQFYLNGGLPHAEWLPEEARLTHSQQDHALTFHLFAPRPLTLNRRASNREGTRGRVVFVMDPQTAPDKRFRDDDRRMLLEGQVSDLLLNFDDELTHADLRAQRETLTLVTVIQLTPDGESVHTPVWENNRLTLGERNIRFDGTIWVEGAE